MRRSRWSGSCSPRPVKNADGQFGGGLDCRFLNANLDQSVNLYRMDKNENMELVVGNSTKMFPNAVSPA